MLQRSPNIEAAPMDGELLLFSPVAQKFFVMNPTAAVLWEALEQPCDEQGLAKTLCAEFTGVTHDKALDDVRAAIQNMRDLGLVGDHH